MRHLALFAAACLTFTQMGFGGINGNTFLHHFDQNVGEAAGPADYAGGSNVQQYGAPAGPGGLIVSAPAKFGTALNRAAGGRIAYEVAGNYDPNIGTIEMWINAPNINAGSFVGLWGTNTSSGNADVRMYIYNTGAGRTLGAYQLNGGGAFWEIEQAIPVNLLTSNEWHHVAWAYDTAAGKTATWWDGVLLRNTPDAGTVNPRTNLTNTRFHIGENQAGSATFPGYIDEFRISDVVRYDMNSNFTPPDAPFAVPEPGMLGLAVGLLAVVRRRK